MEKQAPTYVLDEEFYSLADMLAYETESKINTALFLIIKSYMLYIESNSIEKLRSSMEYGLELLYLGVLYTSYSRKNDGDLLLQVNHLYHRLIITKEFDEIGQRFRLWLDYWEKEADIEQDLPVIMKLTQDFLERCEFVLGRYTIHVAEFIQNIESNYKDREDFIFLTRHKNEYYINMVGAQILNHVFCEEFRLVDQVYVFVPGCMAARFNECKAKADGMGYVCSHCNEICPIHQTEQLSRSYCAKTVIVYHSSELYHTKISSDQTRYGVIGIACVLNLISGGLKAKELGYIPQCVMLDYCGCSRHWSLRGLVTDINKNRLEQLLAIFQNKG